MTNYLKAFLNELEMPGVEIIRQDNIKISIADKIFLSFSDSDIVRGRIDCVLKGRPDSPEMDAAFILLHCDNEEDFNKFIQSAFGFLSTQEVIKENELAINCLNKIKEKQL